MTTTIVLRRSLAIGAALCLGWAVLLFITGGVDWSTPSFRLTSRDPFRPVLIAVLLMLGYWYIASDVVAAWSNRLQVGARTARVVSAGVALAVVLVGLAWGTTAVSGSDPYGYVSQADLWKTGQLTIDQSAFAPWPYEDWTLAPLGYRPGLDPHTIVPTYPPGLPLLLAAADTVGGSRGRRLVVPLLGGLTVWLTFMLGTLVVDELVGLFACVLMAASPAFLYQLMWPMSDVPATAAWTLALVLALGRRRPGSRRRQRPGDCDSAQSSVPGRRRRPHRAPASSVRAPDSVGGIAAGVFLQSRSPSRDRWSGCVERLVVWDTVELRIWCGCGDLRSAQRVAKCRTLRALARRDPIALRPPGHSSSCHWPLRDTRRVGGASSHPSRSGRFRRHRRDVIPAVHAIR